MHKKIQDAHSKGEKKYGTIFEVGEEHGSGEEGKSYELLSEMEDARKALYSVKDDSKINKT